MAARLGITQQAIDDTLYDAFGQRQVSTMYLPLNQYHVVLDVDPGFRQNPDALKHIYVAGTNKAEVPLSEFAKFSTNTTALAVTHSGFFPSVTISFNLTPGYALGDAVDSVEKLQHDLGMPATIRGSFSGAAQAFQASLRNEPILILAALVTVYIVLGILYESLIHPITILSTLPSAGVGALLALMLCKTELNVMGLIGIILLIGIVKKNAIMMIDFALEAERGEGKAPADAIFEACILRFRPIIMTTMAALLGGLPLALGTGNGAELRRPLGIAIVGGLIFSQVLTLYTTPVVYLYLDQLRTLGARLRRKQPAPRRDGAALRSLGAFAALDLSRAAPDSPPSANCASALRWHQAAWWVIVKVGPWPLGCGFALYRSLEPVDATTMNYMRSALSCRNFLVFSQRSGPGPGGAAPRTVPGPARTGALDACPRRREDRRLARPHDRQRTILFRDGVIVAVGDKVTLPADAQVHDAKGKTLYAGFIDAYSDLPADASRAVTNDKSGAGYWNANITPQSPRPRSTRSMRRRIASIVHRGLRCDWSFPRRHHQGDKRAGDHGR